MFSRNAIVALALQTLQEPQKADFLQYADQLSASIGDAVYIDFPPPPTILGHGSPAELCAINYLATGRGTLWTAIRETIALLEFAPDPRPCANGMTYTLGAYRKGGILGLSKDTAAHPATCRLLNMAVVAVERGHVWTTLAINVDNMTSVHQDCQNSFYPSLLIGVSHHEACELWTAHPHGRCYFEAPDGSLLAGHKHTTSVAGVLFNGKDLPHATCAWHGGCRVVLIAYTIHAQAKDQLPSGAAALLEEVGFLLP
eukprot:s8086_g3.t1